MRGVYLSAHIVRAGDAGSSPHARGLQLSGALVVHGERIIPACAGFTV